MNDVGKIVVSLSTIPPRFPFIGRVMRSIMRQSVMPTKIELYIPRFYRRFPTHSFYSPEVPEGVTIEVVEKDLGPSTKVLYCAKKYLGEHTRIIYCDDDQVYGPRWIEKLLQSTAKRPNECIAGCGHDISIDNSGVKCSERAQPTPRVTHRSFPQGGIKNLHKNIPRWVWRECLRVMINTKLIYPPMMNIATNSGYADIAAGCGGVVVQPRFFDNLAYDIPSVLWSVDDYWLSGCLRLQGINIWVEKEVGLPLHHRRLNPVSHISALREKSFDGHTRLQANKACVQYFRENYGIWR